MENTADRTLENWKAQEEAAVQKLLQKGFTITTAESCTGGMLASMLINVPGISEIYREGYITYANDSKEKLLGVKKETLKQFGAVSCQVAQQMAEGAAKAAGADAALSVTGIAGPGGGSLEKPVGLVYIACCIRGKTRVTENRFQGDRLSVRQQSARSAVLLLLSCLEEAEVNEEDFRQGKA